LFTTEERAYMSALIAAGRESLPGPTDIWNGYDSNKYGWKLGMSKELAVKALEMLEGASEQIPKHWRILSDCPSKGIVDLS
jgi:hypothetical protein